MNKLRLRIAIASVFAMIILSGCETMPKQYEPQKSQAQLENERIRFTLTNAQASFKTCQDEIKKSDLLLKIYQDILLENDESPNKYTLLANKNKPNNEQIESLKESMPTITKCRPMLTKGYQSTPFITPTLKFYNVLDAIYIKLIKGEMTIGDANEEIVKADGQRKLDWANTGFELDARFRAMHESEMQGRRQEAAAMLPYLMQQQQIQQMQQNQYMLQQQQIQNSILQKPVIRTPIQTQCYRDGNYVNCTTN